jgi:hypothetical protein
VTNTFSIAMSADTFGRFIEIREKVLAPEPPVTAGAYAVGGYYPLVTPPSQGVVVYSEQPACLSRREQIT